jgi:hypothetical protein
MRKIRLFWASVAVAAALLVATGAPAVLAGTHGQELALRDYNGYANSAAVNGVNQNCLFEQYFINQWLYYDYDISGYYWQTWSGCLTFEEDVSVWGYTEAYGEGTLFHIWSFAVPHSQSSAWYTCMVDYGSSDGLYGCEPGENSYG